MQEALYNPSNNVLIMFFYKDELLCKHFQNKISRLSLNEIIAVTTAYL